MDSYVLVNAGGGKMKKFIFIWYGWGRTHFLLAEAESKEALFKKWQQDVIVERQRDISKGYEDAFGCICVKEVFERAENPGPWLVKVNIKGPSACITLGLHYLRVKAGSETEAKLMASWAVENVESLIYGRGIVLKGLYEIVSCEEISSRLHLVDEKEEQSKLKLFGL